MLTSMGKGKRAPALQNTNQAQSNWTNQEFKPEDEIPAGCHSSANPVSVCAPQCKSFLFRVNGSRPNEKTRPSAKEECAPTPLLLHPPREIRSASTRKPHNAKEREVVNTRITAVPVVLCFLHYCTEFGMDNEQEGVCFRTSLRVDIRFRGKDAAAEESRPAEEKQETVTA